MNYKAPFFVSAEWRTRLLFDMSVTQFFFLILHCKTDLSLAFSVKGAPWGWRKKYDEAFSFSNSIYLPFLVHWEISYERERGSEDFIRTGRIHFFFRLIDKSSLLCR